MQFQFWVLTLLLADGSQPASVFVNLSTLMKYWGHKLTDVSLIKEASIKLENFYCASFTDNQETILEVEIFNTPRGRYQMLYFSDVKDLVRFQTYHESYVPCEWDFGGKMVKSLHIIRD